MHVTARPHPTHFLPALAGLALLCAPAIAETVPPPAVAPAAQTESMEGEALSAPEARIVLRDCVGVRREPQFIQAAVRRLVLRQQVMVDRKKGDWLHLQTGGWVEAEHLGPLSGAAAPTGGFRVLVTKDGARVRSGPGTGHAQVQTLTAGTLVDAVGEQAGWWKLADGGYLWAQLAARQEPVAQAAASAETPETAAAWLARSEPEAKPGRWSLLDVNGMLIEVSEFSRGELCEFKTDMAATGLLQSDWTLLKLRLSVPDGKYEFAYSPEAHGVLAVNSAGARFPSILVQGPLEKLPLEIRHSLEPRTIGAGETHECALIFRPALQVRDIAEVWMQVGGRVQQLFREP